MHKFIDAWKLLLSEVGFRYLKHFILNYSLDVGRCGRQFPSITDLMNEVNCTKIISKNHASTRHQSVMQSWKRISTVSLNDSFELFCI